MSLERDNGYAAGRESTAWKDREIERLRWEQQELVGLIREAHDAMCAGSNSDAYACLRAAFAKYKEQIDE